MASLPSRLYDRARALVVREDSHTSRVGSESGSAVQNFMSGLGGVRDSGAMARPNTVRDYLDIHELIALLRGTSYRRIVQMHPNWATTKGWELSDDTDDEKPLFKEMKRLDVVQSFRRADTWGRALGESRIWLITDDPAPQEEPLDPSKVTKLHRLEILDRREFTPTTYNTDASVDEIGKPEVYHVHPRRTGVSNRVLQVHSSRLLRFYGDDLPPSEIGFNFTGYSTWGADAIGQTLWDGIRNLAQTGSGGARLAQELSIAVFKLGSSSSKSAGDQRNDFIGKMRAMNMMKSIAHAIFLKVGEDYARVAANPAGFKDLSDHARMELGLLTGIPLTLLIGLAPSGMNTDGESWQKMWSTSVSSHQEERYRDPLETIIEILYYIEHGAPPDMWDLTFRPLGKLTDLELADIRLKHTQADSLAILDGVLTPEDARERYTQPGGFQIELQPLEEEPEIEGLPVPDPAIEEDVRKMIEKVPKATPTETVGARRDAMPGTAWIGLPLPDSILPAWTAAREAVASVVDLADLGDAPHVTVLFMGEVDLSVVPDLLTGAVTIAERAKPARPKTDRLAIFGDTVVIELGHAWDIGQLHGQLLRRLAHLITYQQLPTFRAHVSLGDAKGMTSEQRAAVLEVEFQEFEWTAAGLEIRRGGDLLRTVPLAGREDDGDDAKHISEE